MSDIAIEVNGLTKIYQQQRGWRRIRRDQGNLQAVSNIDLQVREGELFGLLGPNGAGKTTLVKMLCTLILPTSGDATVAGYRLKQDRAIKANVGLVVTDERSFYWRLSARRNLMFFAAMHGLFGAEARQRVDETLDMVQLLERADTIFSEFSTGMRQRMAIARGMLHRPKILFLDEPTRSLDPISTNNLHEQIEKIQAERNMTVFLITHDLSEAEKLCDRVGVMHNGQLRGLGSSAELRTMVQPFRNYAISVSPFDETQLAQITADLPALTIDGQSLRLKSYGDDDVLDRTLRLLQQNGLAVESIDAEEPSLETVFNSLTRLDEQKEMS